MADDGTLADLLPALSPLTAAGLDPDEARLDRAGTMEKLLGPAPEPAWYEQAQNDAPPQLSPNGNKLPQGLGSRQAQQDAPAAPVAPTTPTGATPGGVTPTGNPKPDLATSNAATIGQMQQDYTRSSQDVQNEAAQPDEDTVLAPLERQRVSAQARQVELQNPYDPKTGKMLDEYKPNFGTRMMRLAGAVYKGGVLGAADPAAAGATPYGAPNKQLAIDQAQAAGRVAGADQQLQVKKQAWEDQSKRMQQIVKDRQALATTGKDVTGASTQQQQVPIDQQKADTESQKEQDSLIPKNYEETVVAANRETDPVKKQQLMAAAEQMKTTELKKFAAQRPAGERPSAELQRYEDLHSAAVRENGGKALSTDQLAKLSSDLSTRASAPSAIAPNLADKIKTRKDTAMTQAQTNLKAGYDSKNKRKYTNSDFIGDMNQAQQAFEQSIKDAGGTVNHMQMGDDMNWKGAEPAAQPNAATPPPPKVGDAVKGFVYQGGPPHLRSSWKKQAEK